MKKLLVSFLMLLALPVLAGINVATYIPVNAKVYIPQLKAEQVKFWSSHPAPMYLAGLAEQESCLSLTHSKCWSPKSQLKTQREEGSGIFQDL